MVFDINNLKIINDKNGHAVGDYTISKVAEILQRCFVSLGNCYRIGGDEFVVICKNRQKAEITSALEQLKKYIDSYNQSHKTELSLAHGYAFRNSLETSVEKLFEQADRAMYACKKQKIEH